MAKANTAQRMTLSHLRALHRHLCTAKVLLDAKQAPGLAYIRCAGLLVLTVNRIDDSPTRELLPFEPAMVPRRLIIQPFFRLFRAKAIMRAT